MLEWRRMYRYASRFRALGCFTFLAIIANPIALAGTLREDAVIYREQGYEAQRQGQKADALAFYQKAAQLDPSYPTPHNDVGILLEEQGRLRDAEQSYLQALQLNPNYLEPHANLAMLYERLGEREKAIYNWMKRFQLGESTDPWTARAEERLVALGVFKDYPGMKGKVYTRKHVWEEEFKAQDQSLNDFRDVTKQHDDWP